MDAKVSPKGDLRKSGNYLILKNMSESNLWRLSVAPMMDWADSRKKFNLNQ